MTLGQKLRACVRILMGEPTAFDVEIEAVGDMVAIANCSFYGDTRIAIPETARLMVVGNRFHPGPKIIRVPGGPPLVDGAPEGEGGEGPSEEEVALEAMRKDRLEKIEDAETEGGA